MESWQVAAIVAIGILALAIGASGGYFIPRVQTLESELDSSKKDSIARDKQIANLTRDLESRSGEARRLQEQVAGILSKLSQEVKLLGDLTLERDNLAKESSRLKSENNGLSSAIQDKDRRIANLTSEILALKEELKKMQDATNRTKAVAQSTQPAIREVNIREGVPANFIYQDGALYIGIAEPNVSANQSRANLTDYLLAPYPIIRSALLYTNEISKAQKEKGVCGYPIGCDRYQVRLMITLWELGDYVQLVNGVKSPSEQADGGLQEIDFYSVIQYESERYYVEIHTAWGLLEDPRQYLPQDFVMTSSVAEVRVALDNRSKAYVQANLTDSNLAPYPLIKRSLKNLAEVTQIWAIKTNSNRVGVGFLELGPDQPRARFSFTEQELTDFIKLVRPYEMNSRIVYSRNEEDLLSTEKQFSSVISHNGFLYSISIRAYWMKP